MFKRSADRHKKGLHSYREHRAYAEASSKKRYSERDPWQVSRWETGTEWLVDLDGEVLVDEDSDLEEAHEDMHQVSNLTVDEDAASVCSSTVTLSDARSERQEGLWSSCASTAASLEEPAEIDQAKKRKPGCLSSSILSPWELALLRAEACARLYLGDQGRAGSGESRGRPRRRRRPAEEDEEEPRFPGWQKHKVLLQTLASSYGVTTTYTSPGKGTFEQLRWQFFKDHAHSFCSQVFNALGCTATIHATPLHAAVGERFRSACAGEPLGTVVPAFHGTHKNNLDSIYANGLLIPGQGNGVRVANGSVHGLGIYTASMSSSSLPRGYARGEDPPVLICGVLDSSNNWEVYHAGGVMVVFEEWRVAPLFVARRGGRAAHHTQLPQRFQPPLPRPRRIADPNPPMPLRRGPLKTPRKSKVQLPGVAAFLARRAAARRWKCCSVDSR